MELILKQTIDTLGPEGAIVDVKPGFGRNYLLPQGMAVVATKNALMEREKNTAAIQARIDTERGTANVLSKKLSGTTLTIAMRCGEDSRLYGSVTNADIAEKLQEKGITIDKRKLTIESAIKSLGQYNVHYKAGYQITAEFTIDIVSIDAKPEVKETAQEEAPAVTEVAEVEEAATE